MTVNYTADQPVFLNESSKDDRVVLRGYGRAPSGQNPVYHVSLNRGVRYSILPALLLSGYMATRVTEGSIDGAEAALSSSSDLASPSVLLAFIIRRPLPFVINN